VLEAQAMASCGEFLTWQTHEPDTTGNHLD